MRAVRTFDETDQQDFARWSGDINPMHMDALAARRTSAGAPVVHGMHLLLWSLEEGLGDEPISRNALGIRADFRKFVYVDQRVTLENCGGPTGQKALRLLTKDGVAATIRTRAPKYDNQKLTEIAPVLPSKQPREPTFEEMERAAGWLEPQTSDGVGEAFPRLSNRLSLQTVAALMQLSRLVGMVCPGLHSILATVDLDLTAAAAGIGRIRFHTSAIDERYRLVRMNVDGSGIRGTVDAFVRPGPVPAITAAEAAERVRAGQFRGRRALVIGGSRGLGAVTAKLLAAGGAAVTVTYSSGAVEAAAVCSEIATQGLGTCTAVQLDVCKPIPEQLASLQQLPTHIYYFATPRVFLQKQPAFDRPTFDRFIDFYVAAFNALCMYMAVAEPCPISVLFPSSVAVAERPTGLTEYAMAKAAGELLCEDLMNLHANLRIRVARLPRILTDQTATIVRVESADAAEILLPLLED